MHFSILGKTISITIPGKRPLIENGRGVFGDNAIISSQPTYNSTVKKFTSWCAKGQRAILGGDLNSMPERSIVLERDLDQQDIEDGQPLVIKVTHTQVKPVEKCDMTSDLDLDSNSYGGNYPKVEEI